MSRRPPQPSRHRNAKPTTIRDVARLARVGVGTASRAMSGTGPVSATTQARVRAAAAKLRFRPSANARALRGRRSKVLGLIVPVLAPTASEWLRGVTAAVREHGYLLVVHDTANSAAQLDAALDGLYAEHIDGIVLADTVAPEHRLRQFADAGIPVGQAPIGTGKRRTAGCVLWEPAIIAAVQMLVERGHQRIAFCGLGEVANLSPVQASALQCISRCLAAAGRRFERDLIACGDAPAAAVAVCEQLLAGPRRPTAVISGNPMLTARLLQAVLAHHLEIPDDVSVFAIDETGWEAADRPPIAVVRLDHRSVATAIARDVIARIEHWPTPTAVPGFAAEFEPRGSIGFAPKDSR